MCLYLLRGSQLLCGYYSSRLRRRWRTGDLLSSYSWLTRSISFCIGWNSLQSALFVSLSVQVLGDLMGCVWVLKCWERPLCKPAGSITEKISLTCCYKSTGSWNQPKHQSSDLAGWGRAQPEKVKWFFWGFFGGVTGCSYHLYNMQV